MICYWPEPLKVACTLWWLDPIMVSVILQSRTLVRGCFCVRIQIGRLIVSTTHFYRLYFDCSIFIIPAFPILIFFLVFFYFLFLDKINFFKTIFTAVSCQFLFKLLLCIGVLIARDSESKTSIIIFNSLPHGCIRIRTLCLLSLGGLGSVRASGSSTCDLPPAAGWEAGLQADQLLTSWDERIRFCGSAQRSNNLVLNIKSSVCLSYLCCCLDL